MDSDVPDDLDAVGPRRRSVLILGVLAALLLAIAYYVRPWLHGIVYFVYTSPVLLVAGATGLLVFAIAARINWRVGANAGATVFVIVLLVGGSLAGMYAGEKLGKQTMADSTDVSALAETDPETPRIVTRSVADRYASNTLNFPQYRVTQSEVTIYNDSAYWSYALAPDGLWNHFTKQQHGTVMVDMTQQNAEVETFTGDMDRGVGTAHYNNYKWKTLKQGEFLVEYHDPFMVVHEGEQYVAAPYSKPNFHWFPLPHTTPEWGGIVLVNSDGEMTDLSPAEARNQEVLAEQKLYPFSLARKKVASTKYRNGIVNTFTSHKGEIEVAPVPGTNNDQPFLVLTEDGPKYIVAVEPYGDAQGLKEVWTVDSRTGEFQRLSPNQSLFGPRKATDYVRQAARTTDWNRFNPSEPIPVVVDGQLYWEVRVVPHDSSGIAYVAFVNAQTSDVSEVSETAAVTAFLEGETIPADGEQTSEPERTPELIVKRVAPNGTVVGEMTVYENESVRIVQGNGTTP